MFKRYEALQKTNPGRYGAFHFTSFDNPHISKEALEDITGDMTSIGYRMEILAEDVDEAPGALWTRDVIEKNRIHELPRDFDLIVVGLDPSATSTGDEAGIITGGKIKESGFVLEDNSVQGPPLVWAKAAVDAYHRHKANKIIAEKNQGGEMISQVISQVDPHVPVELVSASRGKATRAEPVSAMYSKNRCHHYGYFPKLEDELCLWVPGDNSPNRLDALVWCMFGLGLVKAGRIDWTKFVGGD
jgi:phage terminase large subunit-like protein